MKPLEFDGVIVVEGETDRVFLSTFLSGEIVITNGSDVPRETINYLKEVSKTRPIIVLTDPDYPGLRIRHLLEEEIPGVRHAFMEREACKGKKKLGVAESNKDAVLKALSEVLVPKNDAKPSDVTYFSLVERGLTGESDAKERRIKVMEKLGLGYGNAKTMLKRCHYKGIMLRDIDEVVGQ